MKCLIPNLVSVIIPAHNSENFLRETINSVKRQTYKNWEILIIDDCSTDGTAFLVRNLARDCKLKYIKLSKPSGAALARQKGLDYASGEFVAFLDSDDLWNPKKLETQIQFMKKNNCAVSCTSYEKIQEDGSPTGKIVRSVEKLGMKRLLLDCPVGNLTVVLNQGKLSNIKIPLVDKREDFALWITLVRECSCIYGIPDVLAYYRLRKGSVSHKKFALIPYQWRLYRSLVGCGVLSSFFHLSYWCIIKVFGIK